MANLVFRDVKGTILTKEEGDANNRELESRINERAQHVNGIAALRALNIINDKPVWRKYHTTAGDGGHVGFRGVTGAALGTYVDNNGTIVIPAGGDGSAAWVAVLSPFATFRMFGATGSGTTDDTVPLQNAINYVQGYGGKLYGEPGRYRTTTRLTIAARIHIFGDGFQTEYAGGGGAVPPGIAKNSGTIIYADYLSIADTYNEPSNSVFFIKAVTGAANPSAGRVVIEDLEIENKQPAITVGWVPNATPWCIYARRDPYVEQGGNHALIRNVMLRNATNGIKCDGASGIDLQNIYGTCFKNGVWLDGAYDACHIDHVHFTGYYWLWNTSVITYISDNLKAFTLGRVDNPYLDNLFALQCHTGITFFSSTAVNPVGVTSRAQGNNWGFDDCTYGILIKDGCDISVTNLYFNSRNIAGSQAIRVEPNIGGAVTSHLNFVNIDFSGSNQECLYVADVGAVVDIKMTNVTLRSWNLAGAGYSAFNVGNQSTCYVREIHRMAGAGGTGNLYTETGTGKIYGESLGDFSRQITAPTSYFGTKAGTWNGGSSVALQQLYGANSLPSAGGHQQIISTTAMAIDLGGYITFGGYFNGTGTIDFGGVGARKENGTLGNTAGYLSLCSRDSGGNTTEKWVVTSTGKYQYKAGGTGEIVAKGLTADSPSLGIGYATGAGGTVTQITSKSTGVTLSKVCGAITMDAAALAAGAVVSFVLTNTAIAATDVLVPNHISGGTFGAYTINARCAAGSATIDVANRSAGSLSEAVVIQFVVVKAVNA